MAETKADKALKEAESKNYKVELVVAQTRVDGNGPMVIDLSGYFEGSKYPSVHPVGVRVSSREEGAYIPPCSPLYELEDMESLKKRVKQVISASIVNARQLEAVENLIDDIFSEQYRVKVNVANSLIEKL